MLYDQETVGQHHAAFFHNISKTNHSLSGLRSHGDEMMIVEEHIYLTLRGRIVISELHFSPPAVINRSGE